MSDPYNKILNAIIDTNKGLNAGVSSEIVFGTVITLDPLSIQVNNRDILPAGFFVLGQMCRPHKVTIPHTHKYKNIVDMAGGFTHGHEVTGSTSATDHSHSVTGSALPHTQPDHPHTYEGETFDVHDEEHGVEYVTLEIFEPLKIGDIVLMFSFNRGQRYYVAERLEIDEDDEL